MVLAHEIAHISRNDFLAWICAQVGVMLHFYHPLVHWLAGRLRLEQELAADAAAASLSGGQHRYLQTLAEMALRQAERPIAWPARTFLPTRRTFLRRIEMLRDTKHLAVTTLSRGAKVTTIGLLVLAGIAVAGLRNPSKSLTQSAQAERTLSQAVEQQTGSREKSKGFDLSYVPKDIAAMWAVRSAEVLSLPVFTPLAKSFAENLEFEKQFGVDARQVEQFLIVLIPQNIIQRRRPAMYLTMKKTASFQKLIEQEVGTQVERQEYKGNVYYSGTEPRSMTYFSPNRRTIILADPRSMRDIIDAGKTGPANASWLTAWKEVQNDPVAAVMNMEALKEELQRAMQRAPAGNPFMIVAPIYQQAKAIAFGAGLEKQLKLKIIADCGSKENAVSVKETVDAAVTLGKNMVAGFRQQLVNRPPLFQEKALVELYLGLGETFLKNAKVEQQESTVRLTSSADGNTTAKLVAVLLPSITQARQAARKTRAKNNLKQIALAFHNYHDAHGHFPPAVVIGPNNQTPHSWRVALLPYLAQPGLYKQYNLNEPWDSPNNKKVLAKMPDVFRDLSMNPKSTNSAYFVLTGDVTVFNDKDGTGIREIRDGPSNTILVVEAKRNIPWTKPADIPYDADTKKNLPKLGGFYNGGINMSLCDGRVEFISESLDVATLRALITMDGGETVGDF